MVRPPNFAPGCFGSPLVYSTSDMVCANCRFFAECGETNKVTREKLRQLLGMSKVPDFQAMRRERVKPVAAQPVDESGMVLPRKVRELIERLDRDQLDIKGSLSRGVNPFPKGKADFLRLFCHLLLKLPRLPRDTLETAFMQALGHQSSTAKANARMAFAALEHIGAIEIVDGIATIRRNA